MKNQQKITRNIKILALMSLICSMLAIMPLFAITAFILFIIVLNKLEVHAGAKKLLSNFFITVFINLTFFLFSVLILHPTGYISFEHTVAIIAICMIINCLLSYKFTKNIFYEIARVTHQKYFIKAFNLFFIGLLILVVSINIGLFLFHLNIEISFSYIYNVLLNQANKGNTLFLIGAPILIFIAVSFLITGFVYHALAWLNFESFDEEIKENYATTTQGLKLIKITMIFACVFPFIVYLWIFIMFVLDNFSSGVIFPLEIVLIILGCFFCIFSFMSIILLCKKIKSYKLLLFFTLWMISYLCYFIKSIMMLKLFDIVSILNTISAFFFFKELVKISGMKIFFVFYMYLFTHNVYFLFIKNNMFVTFNFDLSSFIKVYLKGFMMFFDLEKFIYPSVGFIYIYITILFIIAWSRLKIKIMPKA
ncbi:hypothetical protein [Campylobacter lari]|uniref:hypothetical protein n=1 Tax=Campylobacter lari TaxID=201 RepID=UPI0021538809|nr:hypothetical protein [Campylobacter lari]MCR6518910.1 hypothetical protein [Campylobacter lari]